MNNGLPIPIVASLPEGPIFDLAVSKIASTDLYSNLDSYAIISRLSCDALIKRYNKCSVQIASFLAEGTTSGAFLEQVIKKDKRKAVIKAALTNSSCPINLLVSNIDLLDSKKDYKFLLSILENLDGRVLFELINFSERSREIIESFATTTVVSKLLLRTIEDCHDLNLLFPDKANATNFFSKILRASPYGTRIINAKVDAILNFFDLSDTTNSESAYIRLAISSSLSDSLTLAEALQKAPWVETISKYVNNTSLRNTSFEEFHSSLHKIPLSAKIEGELVSKFLKVFNKNLDVALAKYLVAKPEVNTNYIYFESFDNKALNIIIDSIKDNSNLVNFVLNIIDKADSQSFAKFIDAYCLVLKENNFLENSTTYSRQTLNQKIVKMNFESFISLFKSITSIEAKQFVLSAYTTTSSNATINTNELLVSPEGFLDENEIRETVFSIIKSSSKNYNMQERTSSEYPKVLLSSLLYQPELIKDVLEYCYPQNNDNTSKIQDTLDTISNESFHTSKIFENPWILESIVASPLWKKVAGETAIAQTVAEYCEEYDMWSTLRYVPREFFTQLSEKLVDNSLESYPLLAEFVEKHLHSLISTKFGHHFFLNNSSLSKNVTCLYNPKFAELINEFLVEELKDDLQKWDSFMALFSEWDGSLISLVSSINTIHN